MRAIRRYDVAIGIEAPHGKISVAADSREYIEFDASRFGYSSSLRIEQARDLIAALQNALDDAAKGPG